MGNSPCLAEEQLRALDRLSRVPELTAFYLAGGTAIAHHLGHRVSRDLDLFSQQAHVDLDAVRRAVVETAKRRACGRCSPASTSRRTRGTEPAPALEARRVEVS